jgi:hypothetical protein
MRLVGNPGADIAGQGIRVTQRAEPGGAEQPGDAQVALERRRQDGHGSDLGAANMRASIPRPDRQRKH